jgi:hypothetical protein
MSKRAASYTRVIDPQASPNRLIFRDAEKARDSVTRQQQREIAGLYQQWADEIGQKADTLSRSETASDAIQEMQLRDLKRMLDATNREVVREIETKIRTNIRVVADATVLANNLWLREIGMLAGGARAIDAAFSHVPDAIVRRLVTGQLYEGKWNLSERLWGDNRETMRDAYRVVAGGLAQNLSVYDIAKLLEKYVDPRAAKQWNLRDKDGKLIYPKSVDYNAQRLARTLTQHSYQQSFIATTQKNPFITEYEWLANGSRVCEICLDRNRQRYAKDELPLDHPNGMCTMVPVVVEDLTDRIANWVIADAGTFPDIDAFERELRRN